MGKKLKNLLQEERSAREWEIQEREHERQQRMTLEANFEKIFTL